MPNFVKTLNQRIYAFLHITLIKCLPMILNLLYINLRNILFNVLLEYTMKCF